MIGKLLLCGLYLALGFFLIKRSRIFKATQLDNKAFLLLFGIRLFAGLAYAYVFFSVIHGGDALQMYRGGRVVWSAFQEDPAIYFRLVFGPNGGFVDTSVYKYAFETNYWDHFDKWNIIRFHAILCPFTLGSYWVHVVIFTSMNVFGSLFFYQAFRQMTKIPERILFVLVFMMPSLLLFTSMIYKEGFLFLGLGLVIYHTFSLSQQYSGRGLLGLFLGFLFFLLFRPIFFLLIASCIALFFFGRTWKWLTWKPYVLSVLVLIGLVLIGDQFVPGFNLLERIANKQASFISEIGSSDFSVPDLQANLGSFIAFLPIALINAFLRPFLWDLSELYFAITGVGMLFFIWIVYLRIAFRKPNYQLSPILTSLAIFAWSNMLLVGYLVSNEGTIARYRILAIFLMLILSCNAIDWERLKSKFHLPI